MVLHHDRYTLEKVGLAPNEDKILIKLKSKTTKKEFIQRSSFSTNEKKKNIRKLLELFSTTPLPKILYNTSKIEQLNRILSNDVEVELEAKTIRQPTLIESRYFVKYKEMASHSSCKREVYDLPLMEMEYNLATFHFRGNDTCYFAYFNTHTGEKDETCDIEQIIQFVRLCPVTFVMDATGCILLNELVSHGGLHGIKSKRISNMNAPSCIDAISVQDLLGKRHSYDLIAKLAFPTIKAVIPYSEADNCLQGLEALKYVFATHLQEPLAAYEHLKPLFSEHKAIRYSELSERMFSKAPSQPVRQFDTGTYIPYINTKFPITTGASGLGGVHGCLKNFINNSTQQVVYLDYKSYYPSILLSNLALFEDFVNIEQYSHYYNLKQRETNPHLKKAYKTLINTFIGVLGTDKPGFTTLNRVAWEFIIHTGQQIMHTTLKEILNLNPKLNLVHVNTDGAYFVKQRGIEVKLPASALELEVNKYEQIAIQNLNNYIVKVNDEGDFIPKGTYKHCHCPYVKAHVYKELFDYPLGNMDEDNLENFILFDEKKLSRCLKTKLGDKKNSTHIDLLKQNYIAEYNATNDTKITIDKEYYDKLVQKLTFREE